MLIIVAVLVFYNELNKKMNLAEIALLAVSLIAIIRASLNYINLNDTATLELFTNSSGSRKSGVKSKGRDNNSKKDIMVLESERSKEYFDTDENTSHASIMNTATTTTKPLLEVGTGNKINKDAVNQINSILGIKSTFDNIPTSTDVQSSGSGSGIDSIFVPQIQIGKSAQDILTAPISLTGINMMGVSTVNNSATNAAEWGTAFSNDGMKFNNTMKPTNNLWSSDLDYMDTSTNWSQSLDEYNRGKWNPNLYKKPSDYIDYYTPGAYGAATPTATTTSTTTTSAITTTATTPTSMSRFDDTSTTTQPITTTAITRPAIATVAPAPTTIDLYGQPKKLCGAYDDLSMDQSGNLVIQNYTQAKKWVPGYTYVPPVYWDVPQRHPSVCQPANPNVRKLTGLVDRGLPLNVLELNPDGSIADTEDTVKLTNFGSVVPKFNYEEMPFSKPYV